MSKLTDTWVNAWEAHGLEGADMVLEYRFHPVRRWRFDVAFPSRKVAVELNGYGYGHQSIGQVKKDDEKQNAAVELGWRVLRYSSSELSRSRIEGTIEQVCRVLMEGI